MGTFHNVCGTGVGDMAEQVPVVIMATKNII